MPETRGRDPVAFLEVLRLKQEDGNPRIEWVGMTKREHIALQIETALIQSGGVAQCEAEAVQRADELIAQLNKVPGK